MNDFTRYSLEALRTAGPLDTQRDQLICGALGLAGEAAEVSEIIDADRDLTRPETRVKLVKELGDVMWYLALLDRALGRTWDVLAPVSAPASPRRLSCALTIAAGKVADIVKKHAFQGHSLDVDDLALPLAMVMTHLEDLAAAAGSSLDEVAAVNLAKLRARYPDGFDPERSINRAPTEPPDRRKVSPVDVGVSVDEEAYFDGQGSAVRGQS